MFFAILTPLLPSYRSEMGVGGGALGVLSASYAAGTFAMALPAGWVAARVGPRHALIAGLIGFGVVSPAFGLVRSIEALDAIRFIQGASGSLMWAGAFSWIVSAAPKAERGRILGTVLSAAVVGELMGAPLGAFAYQVGTIWVFGSVPIVALALGVVSLTIPPATEVANQPIREGISALRASNVMRGLLMLGGPASAFGLLVVVGPLRMSELGASPAVIAAVFVTGSLSEAILGPWIGRHSDRVGRSAPFIIGITVMAVGVLMLGAFDLLPLLALAVVLIAVGAGFAFTPANALITDGATSAGLSQGYATGLTTVARGGGKVVGSVGAGILAGQAGYFLPALIVALILLGVAALSRHTGHALSD